MSVEQAARAENFKHVWALYGLDNLLHELRSIWGMAASDRAWLLRHHYSGGVNKPEDLHLRSTMDALLHSCGMLEVGFQAGALADEDGKAGSRLLPVLTNPEVLAYSEHHYPLRLPAVFRRRLLEDRVLGETGFEVTWFGRLLSLDASFRNTQLNSFLWVIDGFWYRDINFPLLRQLARDAHAIINAVMTPRDERTRAQEVLAGLERFLLFCAELEGLLAAAHPNLARTAFDLYRYWFEVRRGNLSKVVDDALLALRTSAVADAPVRADHLPERQALAALFARADETADVSTARSRADLTGTATPPSLRELMKLDTVTLRVVELALPAPLSDAVRKRISTDYVADTGMVSLLRATHYNSGSIAETGRLYWNSRRELGSPRLESVLSAVCLNVAAEGVLGALRDLLRTHPEQVSGYLVEHDLSPDLVAHASASADPDVWDELAQLAALFRLRSEDESAAAKVVASVAGGSTIPLAPTKADTDLADILRRNIEVVAKGLLISKFNEHGAHVVMPTNGVQLTGLPASPGAGWGRRLGLDDLRRTEPSGLFVFADPHADPASDAEVTRLLQGASAVICIGGMTSHIPIVCRGLGKPCVALDKASFRIAMDHPWLLVVGDTGEVRCFVDQPEIPLPARPRPA